MEKNNKKDIVNSRNQKGVEEKKIVSLENTQDQMRGYTLFDPRIQQMEEVAEFTYSDLDERKLIYPEMKQSRVVSRFRELRTQLLEKARDKNFVVLVTSVTEGGGATYVASNLAMAFSIDSSKTALLIDANLGKPDLDSIFSLDDVDFGLTGFLENNEVDIEQIIYASGVKRLRVVPAGHRTEYASEYFNSERMKFFLKVVRDRYSDRFIILDAPPLSESSDVRNLVQLCDMAVVVVPYGKVTGSEVAESLKAIPKEKLAGLIINNETTVRHS